MTRSEPCPRKGCEGSWGFDGKVIRGYPRSRLEPSEPTRFEVTAPPYPEDDHSCGGELTEEEEANLIQKVEADSVEPFDDYDPCEEETWWE